MKFKRWAAFIAAIAVMCSCAFVFAETAAMLRLPEALEIIDEEAFCGSTSIKRVEISGNTVEIRSRAFADSTLTEIVLPGSLTYIAEDIFDGCSEVLAFVDEGSYAHGWCLENGVDYAYLNGTPTPEPPPTPDPVVYRALLLGNTYPGTSDALDAPDDDVAGMAQMLALQKKTPYAVTTKLNLSAVEALAAIGTTFAEADSDDVSLFYYSGHGSSVSGDGLGALICIGNTYITVSQLRAQLDTVPGKKIVLLDCCHSGAHIARSAGTNRAEAFNDAVIAAFSVKSRSNLATEGYTVLTACSQTESSWELTISSGFGVGFFSQGIASGSGYDLINREKCAMHADNKGDLNGMTSLGEAYDYAVEVVEGYTEEFHVAQNIQYYGNDAFILWGSGMPDESDSGAA